MRPLQRLGRLLRDRDGLAAVEFAFVAPILIMAYFGVAELCGALLDQRKTSHVASAIGDLTAQYSAPTSTDISNFFAAGQTIMSPSPTTTLQMRISAVQENAAGTAATVIWSVFDPAASVTITAASSATTPSCAEATPKPNIARSR